MDGFKQIADDCLKDLRKGCFILRNGHWITSDKIQSNRSSDGNVCTWKPYILEYTSGTQIWLDSNGNQCFNPSPFDVVDFVDPIMNDNNVSRTTDGKVRTLSLSLSTARDWYNEGGTKREIALYLFDKDELVPSKPKTWEQYKLATGFREDIPMSCGVLYPDPHATQKERERVESLLRLIAYRKGWVDDWVPYWDDWSQKKYVIRYRECQFKIYETCTSAGVLSFPTFTMADEFRSAFKEDLCKAIGLY